MAEGKNPQELLELVESRIMQFQQELAEGKPVNLKGFEERVHVLCELVTSLPKEEALKYELRLREISSDLQKVSDLLTEQYQSVKDELKKLETKQKAQDAYNRATKTKPPEDKE